MTEEEVIEDWRKVPLAGIPQKVSTEYKTGDWRFSKPMINHEKCTKCLICYIHCPDGCVSVLWKDEKTPERVEINYDYCKGCGICAEECPVNAIEMVEEEGG